ncbi:FAD-dependent oxidoreductase [Companilactobacillus hulinensis]|uniref:FAD-dependent oxidoreductase n=1 Tax=Companilactobacillus hulinensis TaxID=2486007 RepID=UPI000F78C508|nr:FAD-dependent oxidoreductase [Companilactobacillus hulinensis]
MGKRILIVGGNAGGASVAARARRLDEDAEIIMFEKGPYVSYSNCSLPYYLSGVVENVDDMVMKTPEQFEKQYNIKALVNNEVISGEDELKTITVKNLVTGKVSDYKYDELVLATGATPVLPSSIKGIHNSNVYTVRDVEDIKLINDKISGVNNITVIGGGFIGLEMMENLSHAGKKVTVVEATKHVMATIDDDMAQLVHKEIIDNGVNLIVDDGVKKITDDSVVLSSGKTIPSEVVIAAIGVKPNVELADNIGLQLGETGAIEVYDGYQTSVDHIYAVGDAIEVTNMLTRKKQRLNLSGPAQMQARDAADHMYHRQTRRPGVIGTQVVKVFGLNIASTGLTQEQAGLNNFDYRTALVIPKDKVEIMPDASPINLKLVFGYPSGEILGAQALGKGDVDKQIDVIATMITMHGKVEDLQNLELAYQPLFSTPKNAVNVAGMVATNILNGEFKQVPISVVRILVEHGAFIMDVREPSEFARGHLRNAVNIPMSQFRDRLKEIPHDRPVYVHCQTSQRGYNVTRALNNLGYTNVNNIQGSFLGISEYEYYHDVVDDRDSIIVK